MENAPENKQSGAKPGCAICGKPVDPATKPFCSRRCANIDLNRWLKGAYVIAGEPVDEDLASLGEAEFD